MRTKLWPARRPSAAIQSRMATSTSSKPAGKPGAAPNRATTICERAISHASVSKSRHIDRIVASPSSPNLPSGKTSPRKPAHPVVPFGRAAGAWGSRFPCQGVPARAAVRRSCGSPAQSFGSRHSQSRPDSPSLADFGCEIVNTVAENAAKRGVKITCRIRGRVRGLFAHRLPSRTNSPFNSMEYYPAGHWHWRRLNRT